MDKYLNNLLFQLIVFIGVIYLFGFIISLINRLFYSSVKHSKAVCYATGLIGTPIHELSHASMCILFGHKINEIKLYQIDEQTGVMGYVNHSYNKRNLYHVLGNYLIGVAPIVVGVLLMFLASKLFLPKTNAVIVNYVNTWVNGASASTNAFSYIFKSIGGVIKAFFNELSFTNLSLLFVLLGFCLCLHMNLSGADIKGSLGSVPLWIILIAIVNAVLCFVFAKAYRVYLRGVSTIAIYLTTVMLISLLFSLFYLAITGGSRGIIALVKKIKR